MTTEQMRKELIASRPNAEWREKVGKMTGEKVFDVYSELQAYKKTQSEVINDELSEGPAAAVPLVQDAFMTALSTDKPLEYGFPNGALTIRMNYADTTIGECVICSKEVLLSGWEDSLNKTIIFGDRERTVTGVRVIAGFIFVDLT